MIKRPLFLFVALSLLVAVCAIAFVRVLFRFDVAEPQPVQAQAQSVMAQPTASPQPSATPSPMPTVDYQLVWPAQTQAAAAYELAQAQERIARAAATMARATEQAYQSALIAGTPTAQARETQRAEATAQAQADVQAAYIQQERARIMAAIETDEHAKRTAENIRLILVAMGAGVVFVLIVTVIRMLDYRAKTALFVAATGAATESPLENLAPVTDAPAALPAYPGGLDVRLFAAFLSPGTLRKAARLVRAGVPLTHDNYTPILACMSEGQFTKLQNALVEYHAAEWVDETHKAGIALTEKGERFFADLLTTSPLNQYAPGTPSGPVKQPIDDGFTPIGEGGGAESENL